MTITVLELYPHHLAVNGDMGNNIVLHKRMTLGGLATERVEYEPGEELPSHVDIVTIGSGPESALRAIAPDIARIAPTLRRWAEEGVPMLAITAGMHLFGRSLTLSTGDSIEGAGVFDLSSKPRSARALTNSFIVDSELGRMIGVENHGAVTTLGTSVPSGTLPFGTVVNGIGNSGGKHEGARVHNAIGTHLHGPVLAMNPALADDMIRIATERSGLSYRTTEDHHRIDSIARQTRSHLAKAAGASVERRAG